VGQLPYLSNRARGLDRRRADNLAGENASFFSILECGTDAALQVGARVGALRDGWNATVFKHGVERSTHS